MYSRSIFIHHWQLQLFQQHFKEVKPNSTIWRRCTVHQNTQTNSVHHLYFVFSLKNAPFETPFTKYFWKYELIQMMMLNIRVLKYRLALPKRLLNLCFELFSNTHSRCSKKMICWMSNFSNTVLDSVLQLDLFIQKNKGNILQKCHRKLFVSYIPKK